MTVTERRYDEYEDSPALDERGPKSYFITSDSRVKYMKPPGGRRFDAASLERIFGSTPASLSVLSGDVLFFLDRPDLSEPLNRFASDRAHRKIYGPALLCDARHLPPDFQPTP